MNWKMLQIGGNHNRFSQTREITSQPHLSNHNGKKTRNYSREERGVSYWTLGDWGPCCVELHHGKILGDEFDTLQ